MNSKFALPSMKIVILRYDGDWYLYDFIEEYSRRPHYAPPALDQYCNSKNSLTRHTPERPNLETPRKLH
jgi:hypothetical protein